MYVGSYRVWFVADKVTSLPEDLYLLIQEFRLPVGETIRTFVRRAVEERVSRMKSEGPGKGGRREAEVTWGPQPEEIREAIRQEVQKALVGVISQAPVSPVMLPADPRHRLTPEEAAQRHALVSGPCLTCSGWGHLEYQGTAGPVKCPACGGTGVGSGGSSGLGVTAGSGEDVAVPGAGDSPVERPGFTAGRSHLKAAMDEGQRRVMEKAAEVAFHEDPNLLGPLNGILDDGLADTTRPDYLGIARAPFDPVEPPTEDQEDLYVTMTTPGPMAEFLITFTGGDQPVARGWREKDGTRVDLVARNQAEMDEKVAAYRKAHPEYDEPPVPMPVIKPLGIVERIIEDAKQTVEFGASFEAHAESVRKARADQPAPFEIQIEHPMNAIAERLVPEGKDAPAVVLPAKGEGELF